MTWKHFTRLAILLLSMIALVACSQTTTPTTTPIPTSPATDTPQPTSVVPTQPPDTPTPVPSPTPTVVPTPVGPQAAVIDIINAVDAHSLPEEAWIPAQVDMTIYLEGEVWAKEASTARVGLQDDAFGESVIRVAPNTIFTYGQPDVDTLQIQLDEGQMWIDIEGLEPDKTFEIETPDGIASVRGTRFSVRTVPGRGTIVSTQVGTVTLTTAAATTVITAGNESRVPPGGGTEAPEAVPISPEEQLRWGMATTEELAVAFPLVGSVVTFTHRGGASNPQISPDGRYLAFHYYFRKGTESFYGPVLYDLKEGAAVDMPELSSNADGISFSPQGDKLAYVEHISVGDRICTMSVGAWESAFCFGEIMNYYGWPRWSPDGTWLTYYARVGSPTAPWNLYRSRIDGTEMTPLTSGSDTDKFDPAVSPDGSWLAYGTVPAGTYELPGNIWIARSDGSDARQIFEGAYAQHGLVWAPDSSAVLMRGHKGGLYLYDLATDEARLLPGTEQLHCSNASWAPTGQGWPLFFTAYSIESREYQGVYYSWGQTPSSPLANVSWGPVWSADGTRTIFGAQNTTDEIPTTTFYVTENEPAFYP